MSSAPSDALDITLDRDAEVPLGVQLAWALRARIESGALASGERLPGLHRLADRLGVNANTIRAVYQRLEQDGLVVTRHGSGTFVTGGGGERRALTQLAADAARAARDAGVHPRELAATLYVGSDASAITPDGDVAARRRLRAQIAALEQALSALLAQQARPTSPATPASSTPKPRLLGATELTHQRDELLHRLAEAQSGASRRGEPPEPDSPPARRRAPARRRTPARSPQLRPAPRTT